jgi:uncharacterized protein YdiU (UPF0061 family)
VDNAEDLGQGLEKYRSTFASTHHAMMLKKLGLSSQDEESDGSLIEDLHGALADSEMDMTLFFRNLSHVAPQLLTGSGSEETLFRELTQAASYRPVGDTAHEGLQQWLARYAQRLRQEQSDAEALRESMLNANPKYVLRNYLAQQAIDAADSGDLSLLQTLMRVLKTPFDEQPEHDELAAKRPDWARSKPGCATLSCSS